MLNRVIVSLFNVWCIMVVVVVGEHPDEMADSFPWGIADESI